MHLLNPKFGRSLLTAALLAFGVVCTSCNDKSDDTKTAVATRPEDDPFHITMRAELRALLTQAINELDEKERQVLGLYYLEELTMKEVGLILDIGESRVSQIHTAALLRLRSRLRDKVLPRSDRNIVAREPISEREANE